MKNTLILPLGLLLFAGSLLTSCSSDDGASDNSSVGSAWTLTVKATKGGNEAITRALSESTNPETGKSTIAAKWSTTECVHVYSNKAPDEKYLGFLQPDANKATANLKGSLKTETEIADDYYKELENTYLTLQFPQAGQIHYDGQKGTLEDISSNYDWATATVHIDRIDLSTKTIIPTSGVPENFVNQQAIVKFTLHQSDGTALPNPTEFTVRTEEDTPITVALEDIPSGTYTTNGNGILYVAIPGFESKKVTLEATVGSDKYTYTKSNATFTNGKYYDITVKMTKQQ